ncbi:hypothetical protein [Tenacibaculum halocynthiae]|uniref:hypothetical protein n=1 Tax=Tenacibaculum halocynthiae TaxID=1254437 RepID=UPI003D6471C3
MEGIYDLEFSDGKRYRSGVLKTYRKIVSQLENWILKESDTTFSLIRWKNKKRKNYWN